MGAYHHRLMRRGRHVVLGFVALGAVVIIGTVGYVVLGFGVLDAVYQTVTTITTVGFREIEPLDAAGQVFTIVLILAGVGTALYTLTVSLELIVEGHIGAAMDRRRMDKQISALHDHVIVCGWGRVGRAAARELADAGMAVVIVDTDPERVATIDREYAHFVGDASDDDVLRHAGIERAAALVAAVDTDAANLFITLSGRSLRRTSSSSPAPARSRASTSCCGPAPTGSSTRRRSAAPASPPSWPALA